MQAQTVQKLGLLRTQALGQPGHGRGIRIEGVDRCLRYRLDNRHPLQDQPHVLEGSSCGHPLLAQLVDQGHHGGAVGLPQGLDDLQHMAAIDRAKHLPYRALLQTACTKGNRLVGQAQGVPHGSACSPRQQAQCGWLGLHLLAGQHCSQVFKDSFGCHGPEVELQTARKHCHRDLLRIGGGQHELEVLGGLLQRLEHGIEGMPGQHVDLVNHEDLEAPLHRFVDRLLQQPLDLIDPAIRGSVKFGVVDKTPGIDIAAGLADATGLGGDATPSVRALAVEGFGQDARHRGLAHASGAGEQIGVVQTLLLQGIAQGLDHVLLPDHFAESTRPVLAGQNKIRHGVILSAPRKSRPVA